MSRRFAFATRILGWCGEGPAHGFWLPIYGHEERERRDVRLTAALFPMPHCIDGKAELVGELARGQTHF